MFDFKRFMLMTGISFFVVLVKFFWYDSFLIEKNIEGTFFVKNKIKGGYFISIENQIYYLRTKEILLENFFYHIQGSLIKLDNAEFELYLKSNQIHHEIINFKIIEKNEFFNLRKIIENYLNDSEIFYKTYMNLLIIGNKSNVNQIFVEKIKDLNMIHIFVISGFHFNILYFIFNKGFKLLKINENLANLFIFSMLIFYLYILDFNISSLRSLLFLFAHYVNKKILKNKFSKLEILIFIFAILFLFNFYIIYSLSFLFSFALVLLIYALNVISFKNKSFKFFFFSIFIGFASILFNLHINKSFNMFSIFYNFILSPIVAVLYVFSFILMPFKFLLNYIFYLFDYLLIFLNSTSVQLNLNIQHDWIVVIYFILYVCILFMVTKTTWFEIKLKSLYPKVKQNL
nr:ComEC/Rec2 family competence protein [[Mycoplasma] mobile]